MTDFIDGGDLHQIWQETGSFDEDLIKIYVAEVALVLGKILLIDWLIDGRLIIDVEMYRFPPQRWYYLPRLENGKHPDWLQWAFK